MKSNVFVQKMFQDYYLESRSVYELSAIEKREFGFNLFDEGIVRHKKFENQSNLLNYLRDFSPSDVYYSCAYYEDPEAEMEKKGWIGADLLFDIDADHIATACNKVHDEWKCINCGFPGKGITPEFCPSCGKQKFETRSWPCEICLNSAKEQLVKLLDFLLEDFGFSKSEICLFFSGNRGYHLHVESEDVKKLESSERKEIVDYVIGLGLSTTSFDERKKESSAITKSKHNFNLNIVWNKRLFKGVHKIIETAKEKDFKDMGLRKSAIKKLIENRSVILGSWEKFGKITLVKGIGYETFRKIIDFCIKSKSAIVDTVVTTDIHRLIRLPDTLHGKTGFKKVKLSISDLDKFDPFDSAVAFKKGTAIVLVSSVPKFRLSGNTFGPYKNQKVKLPAAAAVLLTCKGRAEILEYDI